MNRLTWRWFLFAELLSFSGVWYIETLLPSLILFAFAVVLNEERKAYE